MTLYPLTGSILEFMSNMSDDAKVKALEILKAGDPGDIHQLSRNTDDPTILRMIAKHKNASPLTLKMMSIQNSKSIRKLIAKNPNTPYKTLVMLKNLGYQVPADVFAESARFEVGVRDGYGSTVNGLPDEWVIRIADINSL